jgi:hypothetical protein
VPEGKSLGLRNFLSVSRFSGAVKLPE